MEIDMIIIYLLAIVGLSCIGAGVLYWVCQWTATKASEPTISDRPKLKRTTKRIKELYKIHRDIDRLEGSSVKELNQWPDGSAPQANDSIADVGQTMCSSLLKPKLTDKDVILASAVSQIPLKELGGKDSDIIVNVKQELFVNKEEQALKEGHQCIVCKARKEISWDQISCYAQTTIGVLAYKRSISGTKNNLLKNLGSPKSPSTIRSDS